MKLCGFVDIGPRVGVAEVRKVNSETATGKDQEKTRAVQQLSMEEPDEVVDVAKKYRFLAANGWVLCYVVLCCVVL